MNTKAVRIYGVKDLRLEEFELPTMKDDEIEARIVTDSLCMSTYKVSNQGEKHKKLPNDLKNHPVIMGHEFCGVITKVGEKWKHLYKPGDCFVAQPNLGRADTFSLGYSFPYVGGEATNVVIMNEAIEKGCLLPYKGEGFFEGALVEPLSCIVAGFKANFHLRDRNDYDHTMGIKEGGALAILGGTGPMGFLAIDYAIHNDRRPKHLVVTGRTQSKLDMAKRLYPVEEAAKYGVTLTYVLTADEDDIVEELKALTPDAKGFDDIFLMAAKERLVTQAEQLLAYDGCLNFFAGPADSKFASTINFYNINEELYLVYLPGYGYAKVSEQEKAKWGQLIERYLHGSEQLKAVFLLIDIRHDPSANDKLMYSWIVEQGFNPIIIATKLDKIKRSQVQKQIKAIRQGLNLLPGTIVIPFSSVTKQGRDEIWELVETEFMEKNEEE